MEEIKNILIHLIELIVLFTLLLELLIFIRKIFQDEKGSRSLMLLLLLATVCVRDIMLTLEVKPESLIDKTMFSLESIIIFLVFIIINVKEFYEKKRED